MNWIPLQQASQLEAIKEQSKNRAQVIFKHSTRCSISSVAKSRLDKLNTDQPVDFYYLDILNYRPLSNLVATEFKVTHESPQILVIREGACVYDESHLSITPQEVLEQAV